MKKHDKYKPHFRIMEESPCIIGYLDHPINVLEYTKVMRKEKGPPLLLVVHLDDDMAPTRVLASEVDPKDEKFLTELLRCCLDSKQFIIVTDIESDSLGDPEFFLKRGSVLRKITSGFDTLGLPIIDYIVCSKDGRYYSRAERLALESEAACNE